MTSQTQAAAASAPTALPRRFGLLQATALNMSTMIGVGPFITIPVLMAAMGGPQAMLGWVVALVIACSDGLVWSELGAMMPGSGGSYDSAEKLSCYFLILGEMAGAAKRRSRKSERPSSCHWTSSPASKSSAAASGKGMLT